MIKVKAKKRIQSKNNLKLIDGFRSPNFDLLNDTNSQGYKSEFRYILNYANYIFDIKDSKEFFYEYCKKENIKDYKCIPDSNMIHIGKLAYICLFAEKNLMVKEVLNNKINELRNKYDNNNNTTEALPDKKSKKDIITNLIIEELEGLIDDVYMIAVGKKEKIELLNPIDILKKYDINLINTNKILTYYENQLSCINSYDDNEVIHNKKETNRTKKLIEIIIKDLNTCEEKAKALLEQKPKRIYIKKPKKIIPSKMVKNLKYMKEYDSGDGLVLKSEFPAKIVGSSSVWIYNTKYGRIQQYQALDTSGIMVKGTTLYNYDKDKSTEKKLKKPKDFIYMLEKSGKIEQRKILDQIKTKRKEPNGRLNESSIIIKIY